jgi:hypothetical protein
VGSLCALVFYFVIQFLAQRDLICADESLQLFHRKFVSRTDTAYCFICGFCETPITKVPGLPRPADIAIGVSGRMRTEARQMSPRLTLGLERVTPIFALTIDQVFIPAVR